LVHDGIGGASPMIVRTHGIDYGGDFLWIRSRVLGLSWCYPTGSVVMAV
jgi:hypothetical protein